MTTAKKCDRCGKLYEFYERQIDKCNTNGIALIFKHKFDDDFRIRKDIDLCGDCLTELIEWFERCDKGGDEK